MRASIANSIIVVALIIFPIAILRAGDDVRMQSARPIWLKGQEKEMNALAGFRAVVEAPANGNTVLRVAAASIYRAWINEQFLGCGPARGPHGYFRVDEWNLDGKLKPGKNLVAIEVAGYNANSYDLLDQPSFLQAEVVAGNRVLASTAGQGELFTARRLDDRVQKAQRYSFQRPFIEVYRLKPDYDLWRRNLGAPHVPTETAVQPAKNLLVRRVLPPDFTQHRPITIIAAGHVEPIEKPKNLWKDRSLTNIGPKLKGFPENELAAIPSIEAQRLQSVRTGSTDSPYSAETPIELAPAGYRILDMGVNRTGFVGARVTCPRKTRLWFLFDEILSDDDVDFKRLDCVNIISYEFDAGVYDIEAMEPYTFRYLKLLSREGACAVENVYLCEYAHPSVPATFASSDERLNRIFAAGVETFRQNSLDIFMDCPSRERAGWLCDSYFTARVALDLTGRTLVERNFVENFLLPRKFEALPDGMLPMCYPADHNNHVYIPNWALWFVLQLEEYNVRGGDAATIDALQPRIVKLLDFFKQYENNDGLLEKLPSWVFVEWSEAAKFVQDVNYPSNMLYAGALAAAGRMYQRPDLEAKAERIRQTIRRQSFDGRFFVDNAVRGKDRKLNVTRNRTEVCQYYAFYFQVATPQSHPELWQVLRDEFGPKRKETKAYPEIHPANSFIGNVLRIELLSQSARSQQILDESIAYLLYMSNRTGTLWEHVDVRASCCHGFASHVVHTLYRDVLGIRRIDPTARTVAIQFGDADLDHCEGEIPTPDGPVRLHWKRRADRIEYKLTLPAGYQAVIANLSGKFLLAQ